MARVVLVTGVSRYLGGRLARLLGQHPDVERVIGVDVIPPPDDLGNAEFVRADIRNPVIAKVIKAASVDTVVHMNVIATPVGAGGRSAMKEINVIGTMQLLAACQRAASVQAAGGEVLGHRLRRLARRTRPCSPRTWRRSGCRARGSPRTPSRSRATSAASPGDVRTCR